MISETQAGVNPQNRDQLLRVRDAAEVLAVHPRTVRNLIADGKIPAVRVGRCVRIRQDDLKSFIAATR